MKHVLTTCIFCGCGCGIYLHVDSGRVTGVSPSRNHPVSKGNLCIKGWHVHEFIHSKKRLTQPLVRKDGELRPATWEEALDTAAQALSHAIKTHGPDAVGCLSSARCTNEENYLAQKLTRAVFKTNNVDHCARL